MATSTHKRDYYEVLGVPKDATLDQIKKAYRKLALKNHPDRNKDDKAAEERFKEAAEAYAILSDSNKRAQYDQFGHSLGGSGFQGFQGFEENFRGFSDVFGDLFEDFFGTSQRRHGSASGIRGADLEYSVEMSLEDVAHGKEMKIEFPRAERCSTCQGSGAEPGTKKTTCPDCGGVGEVRSTQGFFTWRRTCPTCGGEGEQINKPCRECRGTGRTKQTRKLNIKIPAGIDDGSQLKITGEGEAGERGGSRGNLYVYVTVKPHPVFERSGNHLLLEVNVGIDGAALGTEIEVPTLNGKVRLKIPPGTQPGKVFRLKGKGITDLRGFGVGDQLVRVNVEIPEKLTNEERKVLEEFGRLHASQRKGKSLFGRWQNR